MFRGLGICSTLFVDISGNGMELNDSVVEACYCACYTTQSAMLNIITMNIVHGFEKLMVCAENGTSSFFREEE